MYPQCCFSLIVAVIFAPAHTHTHASRLGDSVFEAGHDLSLSEAQGLTTSLTSGLDPVSMEMKRLSMEPLLGKTVKTTAWHEVKGHTGM